MRTDNCMHVSRTSSHHAYGHFPLYHRFRLLFKHFLHCGNTILFTGKKIKPHDTVASIPLMYNGPPGYV
jgi:hypothetical protein